MVGKRSVQRASCIDFCLYFCPNKRFCEADLSFSRGPAAGTNLPNLGHHGSRRSLQPAGQCNILCLSKNGAEVFMEQTFKGNTSLIAPNARICHYRVDTYSTFNPAVLPLTASKCCFPRTLQQYVSCMASCSLFRVCSSILLLWK